MKVKPMLINIPDEDIKDLRKPTAVSAWLEKLINEFDYYKQYLIS